LRLLILDNYDSFTYNLYHYCLGDGREVVVKRNNEISIAEALEYDGLILSPGPGLPGDAGIMPRLIELWPGNKPLFGVCLGMQGIAENYGGSLHNLGKVKHGQAEQCYTNVDNELLFQGIASPFVTGHYHSWVVDENTLPPCLEITARNEEGLIMALRHHSKNVRGVQFHPESVLTPDGKMMMNNWLNQPI
jgi:anthranilate synthase component 2